MTGWQAYTYQLSLQRRRRRRLSRHQLGGHGGQTTGNIHAVQGQMVSYPSVVPIPPVPLYVPPVVQYYPAVVPSGGYTVNQYPYMPQQYSYPSVPAVPQPTYLKFFVPTQVPTIPGQFSVHPQHIVIQQPTV